MLLIKYKEVKLLIVVDKIAYIGLFLIRKALKWFKFYLREYKRNKLIITNLEV